MAAQLEPSPSHEIGDADHFPHDQSQNGNSLQPVQHGQIDQEQHHRQHHQQEEEQLQQDQQMWQEEEQWQQDQQTWQEEHSQQEEQELQDYSSPLAEYDQQDADMNTSVPADQGMTSSSSPPGPGDYEASQELEYSSDSMSNEWQDISDPEDLMLSRVESLRDRRKAPRGSHHTQYIEKRPASPKLDIAATQITPGPASYTLPSLLGTKNHTVNKHQLPAYSFARNPKIPKSQFDRGNVRNLGTRAKHPGPKYKPGATITRTGDSKGPAFSLAKRCMPDPYRHRMPGPGDYHAGIEDRGPKYSMRHCTKIPEFKFEAPGPAGYNLPDLIGHKITNITSAPRVAILGNRKHHCCDGEKEGPGPGRYGLPPLNTYKNKDPAGYSMKISNSYSRNLNAKQRQQGPGPAAYHTGSQCSSAALSRIAMIH
eukprot:scpid66587/ scgid1218/ Outer dense fiber protein 3; Outer dense fiber of sperm tails protein 3